MSRVFLSSSSTVIKPRAPSIWHPSVDYRSTSQERSRILGLPQTHWQHPRGSSKVRDCVAWVSANARTIHDDLNTRHRSIGGSSQLGLNVAIFIRRHLSTKPSTRRKMAVQLPKLPAVEKLSTSVIRVLGGNPNKFTLQGTNTYILGTGPSRILLDTAQGYQFWADSLSSALEDHNTTISTCLLSHWHGDHVLGIDDLQTKCPSVKVWKYLGNACDPDKTLTNVSLHEIKDDMTFTDDNGFEVTVLHCPGHTKDHTAFIVTQSTDSSEVGSIFTADNVLGHGTAVFEDLATYLRSLDVMKSHLPRDKTVRAYPGHGAVIDDASAKIAEYIEHRRMREEEALNVLRYGTAKKPTLGKEDVSGKEWESMEMVKVIYSEYPEHLYEPAERGLLMVLAKLKGDGKVVKTPGGNWKVGEKATL